MLGRLFHHLFWGLVSLLLPFTLAIMITWNTLPDQPLYHLKRELEKVALFIVSPSIAVKASVHNELIDRRTSEAVHTLTQSQSSSGLYELQEQINAASAAAITTPSLTKRRQAAVLLAAKLSVIHRQLETAKQPLLNDPDSSLTLQDIIDTQTQIEQHIALLTAIAGDTATP